MSDHRWAIGDMCKAVYNNVGEGLVYRVVDIVTDASSDKFIIASDGFILVLVPVHGVLANIKNRKRRELGEGWCTPLSLVDLAAEYARFGEFIAEEAKKRSEDG